MLGEIRQAPFPPQLVDSRPLQNIKMNIHVDSAISTKMTSLNTSVVELPNASTRLRTLILKKTFINFIHPDYRRK